MSEERSEEKDILENRDESKQHKDEESEKLKNNKSQNENIIKFMPGIVAGGNGQGNKMNQLFFP